MASYADINELIADVLPNVKPGNAPQVATITRITDSVSRFIDGYCDRPENYFAALGIGSPATPRRFRGRGKNFLPIARHVAGSATVTNFEVGGFYEHPINGWLYINNDAAASGGGYGDPLPGDEPGFADGALYIVNARWGFEATPTDIRLATEQIVGQIWDRGQGVIGEISPTGFVIERDIPLTARAFLDKWIRREHEIN